MARIQILNLPGDGHPFALIIDQMNWPDATASFTGQANAMAEQTGARGVILFEDTVEIVGQDIAPAALADETGVDWEAAAARNGQLYSACENQRDDLREAIARVRSIPATPQAEDAQSPWSECYKLGYRHAHSAIQRAIDNPPAQDDSA